MHLSHQSYLAFNLIIITIGIMKNNLQLTENHSAKKQNKSPFIHNKQNQSFNYVSQSRDFTKARQPYPKLGQQIRNKVHKLNKFNQSARSHITHMSQSIVVENRPSQQKNVTFDTSERSCPKNNCKSSLKKSILKNSQTKLKQSSSLKKSQMSANSHVSTDQSIENAVGNKAIKDKYQKIKAMLTEKQQKYIDQVYPPIKSSIYLNNSAMKSFCQIFEKEDRCLQWMRLSDIFKDRRLTVWTTNKEQKSVILKGHISKNIGDNDFLATAFNLIGDKKSILEKMFQSQEVNSQGIYYVKIHQTQTNIWKYVIVDDYVPVITKKRSPNDKSNQQTVLPAFLNVQSCSNIVQIWPFLLQKAYAKYYSTYDSLRNGCTLDFVEQITGIFLEPQKVNNNLDKISKFLRSQDTLILAQDKNRQIFPINIMYTQNNQKIYAYMDRQTNFSLKTITLKQFANKFVMLHTGCLHKYFYTATCLIKQQSTKNLATHNQYTLRHLKIEQSTDCQIGVIQKQQRFYRSCLTYEYAWIRIILVQKQCRGYRWINSIYANSKTIKFTSSLTAGEYIVIIMPEWKDRPYDMNLVYMGNCSALFERKPYQEYSNIIQQSCMDLAQRYGKFVQISKNICSYHYIEKNLGFVIQNINNEKQRTNARVMRSIEGLQKYNIHPLNAQFKIKNTIEISIAGGGYFTVVLMTRGGVEQSFLEMFDFGF